MVYQGNGQQATANIPSPTASTPTVAAHHHDDLRENQPEFCFLEKPKPCHESNRSDQGSDTNLPPQSLSVSSPYLDKESADISRAVHKENSSYYSWTARSSSQSSYMSDHTLSSGALRINERTNAESDGNDGRGLNVNQDALSLLVSFFFFFFFFSLSKFSFGVGGPNLIIIIIIVPNVNLYNTFFLYRLLLHHHGPNFCSPNLTSSFLFSYSMLPLY